MSLENKLNKLLDALLKEVIDDESYKSKKIKLEAEKRKIQDKIDNTDNRMEGWRGKVENALDFAYGCQYRFNNGTRADKQEIMMRLGSDLIVNNTKSLDITLKGEYEVLANRKNWKEKYKGGLEPQDIRILWIKMPICACQSIWLRHTEKFGRFSNQQGKLGGWGRRADSLFFVCAILKLGKLWPFGSTMVLLCVNDDKLNQSVNFK